MFFSSAVRTCSVVISLKQPKSTQLVNMARIPIDTCACSSKTHIEDRGFSVCLPYRSWCFLCKSSSTLTLNLNVSGEDAGQDIIRQLLDLAIPPDIRQPICSHGSACLIICRSLFHPEPTTQSLQKGQRLCNVSHAIKQLLLQSLKATMEMKWSPGCSNP